MELNGIEWKMSGICWSVYQVVKKNNDEGIKANKTFIIMQISQMSRLLVSEWDGRREGEKDRERENMNFPFS